MRAELLDPGHGIEGRLGRAAGRRSLRSLVVAAKPVVGMFRHGRVCVVNPVEQAKTMSKDSHSARCQDTKLLGLHADLTHSEAVKRLAGEPRPGTCRRGPAHRRRLPPRRTCSRGDNRPIRAVGQRQFPARARPPSVDAAVPILHDSTSDWSEMHGLYARCERRTADVTQSLTGVLLPPVQGQPAHRLRAVLTSPTRGRCARRRRVHGCPAVAGRP